MEHAHSVLHLFPSCVALENKLETVNETQNREQWRHAFYDKFRLVWCTHLEMHLCVEHPTWAK